MSSVTQRIHEYKQPHGGFIPAKWFTRNTLAGDDIVLYDNENIHNRIVGRVVDYLVRVEQGLHAQDVFSQALQGAKRLDQARANIELVSSLNRKSDDDVKAKRFLKLKDEATIDEASRALLLCEGVLNINDDASIIKACKLVGYDIIVESDVFDFEDIEQNIPDLHTTANIRVMVKRVLAFYYIHGPIVRNGFTFEDDGSTSGGYSRIVTEGKGDFLTKSTLWDLQVTTAGMSNKYALRVLMYYLMGRKSGQDVFTTITRLGVINPRANKTFIIDIKDIPKEIVDRVKYSVLGYDLEKEPVADNSLFEFDESLGKITGYDPARAIDSKIVIIPDTINGVKVKVIGEEVFKRRSLVRVRLPKYLIEIQKGAFCSNFLEQLEMPELVEIIGDYAFNNNRLKDIQFGNLKLLKFTQLRSIHDQLNKKLKVIGEYAFADNYIHDIKLPVGSYVIKPYAFINNIILDIGIPQTITTSSKSFDDGIIPYVAQR